MEGVRQRQRYRPGHPKRRGARALGQGPQAIFTTLTLAPQAARCTRAGSGSASNLYYGASVGADARTVDGPANIHAHTHALAHAHMHVRTHAHTHARARAHTRTHVHTHVHTYRTHTHTHARTQPRRSSVRTRLPLWLPPTLPSVTAPRCLVCARARVVCGAYGVCVLCMQCVCSVREREGEGVFVFSVWCVCCVCV